MMHLFQRLLMKTDGIIITQTPFRLSFLGGGTDFPGYFNEYGGGVLATAIDKYLYVTINSLQRFYEKRIRLSYSKLEFVDSEQELHHPEVREILKNHPSFDGESFLDMHTFADLPASSGMGTSSTFVVGFLHALYALNGIQKQPTALAYEAIDLEREKLKEAGGWQDQITVAFGGFNFIHFKNNQFQVEPIHLLPEVKNVLEESCLLFFTGGTRSSAEIQKQALVILDKSKKRYLDQIKTQALEGLTLVKSVRTGVELVHELGRLLNISWEAKRNLSRSVSNPQIDQMYETVIKAGALGGKLCGAGGHGFLLVLVLPKQRVKVIEALNQFKHLQMKFDAQGTRVVYER